MEIFFQIIEQIDLSVFLTFLLVIFAVYYSYSTRDYNYWKKQGIPSVTAWPIIGTIRPHKMYHSPELFDEERHKKYGRIYGGFEGALPVLYVTEPELIKQVMVKDFPTFTNRRDFAGNKQDPTFGKMLQIMRGDEWKATRSILTPTFTSGKLKQMVYLIEDCVKLLLQSMDKFAVSKQPFNARHCFSSFTLDVIASCAFGIKTNSLQDPDNEFVTKAREAFQAPRIVSILIAIFPKAVSLIRKPFEYFFGNPFAFFADLANNMIDLRIQGKLQPRKDFLDLLIEAQQEEENEAKNKTENINAMGKSKKILSRDVMVANCIFFLLAGYETTATTLACWAYCLATNPQVQDKLIQEIDEAMIESKGNLTHEIVMGLKYLDMTVAETLRLYPPAFRVERACGIDGYKLGDIVLKKESVVVTSIFSLHYDQNIYPNPETYDPERFSAENKAKRHQFAYMPFGLGPRNCIAQRFALIELKHTMAHILSHYRFTPNDATEYPLQFNTTFVLRAPKSITLQVEKRVDRPNFEN